MRHGCIKCAAARQQKEQQARDLKTKMQLGPVRFQAVSKFLSTRNAVFHPKLAPMDTPKGGKSGKDGGKGRGAVMDVKQKGPKPADKNPDQQKKNQGKKGKGGKKDQSKNNNNK